MGQHGETLVADILGYKVVFEGKGWSIIENKRGKATDGCLASHVACKPDSDEYAVEADDEEQGIMSWFSNEEEAICWYCGTSVPAEIQALIHLTGSF